jgi:hypothetical protein
MRDSTELLKCAEECIQRSWKAMACEVVRMNEFEKKSAELSRAFRKANMLPEA